MRQQSILIMSVAFFLYLTFATAQVSTDWRKRYGPPEAERFIVRDGIVMTVSYSGEGRTCKAVIEPIKPQPPAEFKDLLKEIIPLSDRGKEINSLGLSTGYSTGIGTTSYERVNIALMTTGHGTIKDIESATISWKGVQCRYGDQEKYK